MNEQELAKLIAQNAQLTNDILKGVAGKSASGTPQNVPLHGLGGLFSTPGLEREVVTAHVRPTGIASVVPLLPSVDEDPRFATITGISADSSETRPTNPCDDAPYAYLKACNLTARFGLTRRDTKEVDIGTVMKKTNRGDFTDLMLKGRMLGLSGLTPGGLNEGQILTIVTMAEMVTASISAERELSEDMWQGTIATGAFPGLDSQIATGQVDAETGVTCPAVDSDVKDFGYDDVAGGGRSIVTYLATVESYLRFNANRMGLDPVEWILTMTPQLWESLSEVWPCQYNTNRCASAVEGSASRVVLDGRENVSQRDSIREQMQLPINGRMYKVVVDDGINEATNVTDGNLAAGQYASSIYFVPMTIQGGFPVTYRNFLDYSQWSTDVALFRGMEDFWSDRGLYSWSVTQEKWCYVFHLRTEQRIVLRTPHLAGKIQNIMYEPLQHFRSPYTDSDYFADGGTSGPRAIDSYNAVWG